MISADLNSLKVGDTLPDICFGPVSRHTLALYCGGSGDLNPIHVDSDFAKAAGYEDVFAHGMLSMAILGRLLTSWTDQANVRSLSVRFTAITKIHATVTGSGIVSERVDRNGEACLVLELTTLTDDDQQTLKGTAIIAVPNQ